MRRLRHRREHRRLVGRLVQHAAVGVRAAQRRRDVGRDHEHRRARRPRLADRAERVRGARPGRRQRDAEPPGRPRVAVGGVRRGLLVADADEPDRRVAQRLPQREVVHARAGRSTTLDAALLEQVDDQLGAGRPSPRILSRLRPVMAWGTTICCVSFIGNSRRVVAEPVALPAARGAGPRAGQAAGAGRHDSDRHAAVRGLPLRTAVLEGGRGRPRRVARRPAPEHPVAGRRRVAPRDVPDRPRRPRARLRLRRARVAPAAARRRARCSPRAPRSPASSRPRAPVEVHEDGFRARARAAVRARRSRRARNAELIRRLAERYDAPIVEVRGPARAARLVPRARPRAWTSEVVAELLGIGDAASAGAPGAGGIAAPRCGSRCALAVAALLVVAGLNVVADPPGDRTLYGRTGEIHTP